MHLRSLFIPVLLAFTLSALSQSGQPLNQTDSKGRKQGHWIKRYPDESIMYEGFFKDDHPVGEFKRYYENKSLRSVLLYNNNGTGADAVLYHPNGYISAKGNYVNQKKEGKWQFFSALTKDYLILEENYTGNKRNGLSVKFYPDSTVAETVRYVNDIRQGEWLKFYPGGQICLKSAFSGNMINGKFEVWYENGKIQFSGNYINDSREGTWLFYNPDGTLKYRIEYRNGITDDRQLDIDESNFLDSLEKSMGKTPDPEKTGTIW